MWEVDPETKSKLLALQKKAPNAICVDCGAAQPQWASPKFGTFICLECAGIHRGLGVHVSFVRSVQMDSFKVNEVKRMEEGGNENWRKFWDSHSEGGMGNAKIWDSYGVADRYTGDLGEEYKERLSAKIEGRDYVPVPKKDKPAPRKTPSSAAGSPMGRQSPASRTASPALGGQKARNEAYFAKMGQENSSRPDDVHPSQGGKYAGFGSSYEPPQTNSAGGGAPGVDDFQKDPVAALTKGFGWFTSTVGKQAKTVNDGWIQPGMQKLGETDLAAQARVASANAAMAMQKSAKGAADSFNKFVEGEDGGTKATTANVAPERRDFWDSFGAPASEGSSVGTQSIIGGGGAKKPSSSVGTAAMKKNDDKDGWGDDF